MCVYMQNRMYVTEDEALKLALGTVHEFNLVCGACSGFFFNCHEA
jgi:hypothetical protein